MIIWHNGSYKNQSDFSFCLEDRVRFGDGLFETILGVDGKAIFLDQHLQRLYNGAHAFKIPVPYNEDELSEAIHDLLKSNNLHHGETVINLILSRGHAPRGLMPVDDPDPNMIITVLRAPEHYKPLDAILCRTTRRNEGSGLSRYKTFCYGDQILALLEAREKGANEAILMNNKGFVSCSSSGNIYILRHGMLFTPPTSDGALDGIIRGELLRQNLATGETLRPDDLLAASAIFLSNSIRGLVQINSFEGKLYAPQTPPVPDFFHRKVSI